MNGTCSKCGGRVSVPMTTWIGAAPIRTCEKCGATEKNPYGPVVQTEHREKSTQTRFKE